MKVGGGGAFKMGEQPVCTVYGWRMLSGCDTHIPRSEINTALALSVDFRALSYSQTTITSDGAI